MRSPEIRESAERVPGQREQRSRDTICRLNEEEVRAMKIIGAFRAVDRRDLPQASLRGLTDRGLIEHRTVFLRRGAGHREVVVLTREGRDLLKRHQDDGDVQRYYAGLAKPKELEHDLAIYAVFREESAAIQKAGGRVRRVVLDYEFKSVINREMNRGKGPPAEERRARLARDLELPVISERLTLPDLRIEYTDADGREEHADIEVTTRHYRGAHRAGKARSGFRLVSADGPRAAVNDDHHLGFWG